jgi:hypothetical protein
MYTKCSVHDIRIRLSVLCDKNVHVTVHDIRIRLSVLCDKNVHVTVHDIRIHEHFCHIEQIQAPTFV